jgi:hypothetical protein
MLTLEEGTAAGVLPLEPELELPEEEIPGVMKAFSYATDSAE